MEFPTTYKAYKSEFFNLIDTKSPLRIDKRTMLLSSFKTMCSEISKWTSDKNTCKKLLSGPEGKTEYYEVNSSEPRIAINICQAHQCQTTNLAGLYNPVNNNFTAFLNYNCHKKWFGTPSQEEKTILIKINSRYSAPSEEDCKWANSNQ
jgi:hypothetical protein